MTLTEFLAARLGEDEAAARVFDWATPDQYVERDLGASDEYVTLYVSPARVLAEVEAKRRIVAAHPVVEPYLPSDRRRYPDGACDTCGFDDACVMEHGPCLTLRLLAVPHADHPDFQEAWNA